MEKWLEEKLAAIPEDEPDELDKAMIAMAEAENDDELMTLEEYMSKIDRAIEDIQAGRVIVKTMEELEAMAEE